MKKVKKLLAVIMSVCMMLATGITTYAQPSGSGINSETKAMAESLLSSAINDSDLPAGAYSISEAIPSYLLSNGEVNEFNDAQYHVVYCNGSPVCILAVNGANTSAPTYSLCEDFVGNLNETVLDKNVNYSLVVMENQIFAVTENNATEIAEYARDNSNAANDSSVSINSINETEPLLPDEYDSSEVLAAVVDINNLKQTDSKATESLSVLSGANSAGLNSMRSIGVNSIGEVSGTVKPYTQKPGTYCCWAISAWCVGETLNPLGKTPKQCSEEMGVTWGKGPGSNNSKQLDILTSIYSLSSATYCNNTLSTSSMKSLIDTNYPFIMLCFINKDTSQMGHSVTCYKYDDSYSPVKFKVMDSLVPSGSSNWRWMTSSSTDYRISSASNTYTYTCTISPTTV